MFFSSLLERMKLITTSCFIGTIIPAFAYTLSVTNQNVFGDPALPLYDMADNPLTSGSFAVGFFEDDNDVFTNAADLDALFSSFTEYGTTTPFIFSVVPAIVDVVEPSNWDVFVPFGSTDPQVGQNIYVLIGNMETIPTSTEIAVWKSDEIFGTSDEIGNGGAVVILETGEGELLIGNDTGTNVVSNELASISYSNNITLVNPAIPEPSSSFLASLAGLIFTSHRRRYAANTSRRL